MKCLWPVLELQMRQTWSADILRERTDTAREVKLAVVENHGSPSRIGLSTFDYRLSTHPHCPIQSVLIGVHPWLRQLGLTVLISLRKPLSNTPIHFFTIVLNGEPFIRHHINVFRKLPFPWVWHIIEGLAGHVRDTAWGAKRGGALPDEFLATARSTDGTSEYLDHLAVENPGRVILYRKPPGVRWEGKLEMVLAPLANIREECLLWQIDADELWTASQIARMRELFAKDPSKTAAWFYCYFFLAPEFCSNETDVYGNFTRGEWLRVWRLQPGDNWEAHEPPTLVRRGAKGDTMDVGRLNPFTQKQTAAERLVFQHYAYVTEQQLRFKERYYGYAGAVAAWQKLQKALPRAPRLRRFLPWVREMEIGTSHTLRTLGRVLAEPWSPGARALPARRLGVTPLAQQDSTGRWYFHDEAPPGEAAPHIVILRSDRIGDHLLSFGLIQSIRQAHPRARLTLACPSDVSCLVPDRSLLNRIVAFDRERGHYDSRYRREVRKSIEEVPVDLLVCSQYNRDNLANKLSVEIRARRRVGFESEVAVKRPSHERKHRRYARQFHLLVPSVGRDMPELHKYRRLLQAVGINAPLEPPHFKPSPADCMEAEELLRKQNFLERPLLAVFPGAANPIRNVPMLGRAIRQVSELNDFALLGLGAESHHDLVAKTIEDSGRPGVNLAGRTSLTIAAALLEKCRLALGTDTGLAHLACAVGCRNVVILGGGDFGRFFPYSPLTSAVSLPLACYYCHYVCRFPEPYCLTEVPLGTIRAALVDSLSSRSSKPQLFVPKNEKLTAQASGLRIVSHELLARLHELGCELREVPEAVEASPIYSR